MDDLRAAFVLASAALDELKLIESTCPEVHHARALVAQTVDHLDACVDCVDLFVAFREQAGD